MFIEVTKINKEKMLINIKEISAVTEIAGGKGSIIFLGSYNSIKIQENYNYIKKQLRSM